MTRRAEHPLIRATAVVAALCVLLLALFAASPGWHAGLHEHDGVAPQAAPVGSADHICAVTLFASGVIALLVFCRLALRRLPLSGVPRCAVGEMAAQPRYRLVPSHAPPVS